jgi:plastocyanin
VRLGIAAFVAGLVAAATLAGIPALAADHAVSAVDTSGWNPDPTTIAVGDKVVWSNSTGFQHNVCVSKPGSPQGTCDEMAATPSTPSSNWSVVVSHIFNTAGTYQYRCQMHTGMTGTVQVGPTGTTTTTTTTGTTPTGTTPTGTGTGTTPTQTSPGTGTTPTNTYTTPGDGPAPAFSAAPKATAGRKGLSLSIEASGDATLIAGITRRPPGKKRFQPFSSIRRKVAKGRNSVALTRPGRRPRAGTYRIALVLEDAAGNRSPQRVLTVKVP